MYAQNTAGRPSVTLTSSSANTHYTNNPIHHNKNNNNGTAPDKYSMFGAPADLSFSESSDEEKGPKNCQDGCWMVLTTIVSKIVDWGTLVMMMILPSFTTNYVLIYAAPFVFGMIILCANFIRYQYSLIKVFPKVFEVGIIAINLALVLIEIFIKPSHAWNVNWATVVTDAPLFVLCVISIMLGKPFTIEFAKEKAPQDKWNSNIFITINYHITYVWAAYFLFAVVINLIFIFAAPNTSFLVRAIPTLIVLGFAFLFTSHYPPFMRAVMLTKQRKQQMQDENTTGTSYSGPKSMYSDLEQPIL